jgi:drug/metabolite transporter (DMT)-like permease
MAAFKTFLLGYGLLLISLFFDGLMALKEKIVNHEVHHNPEFIENKHTLAWEYMSLFSIYSILFSVVGLGYELIYSDLYKWILIYLSNSHLLINLLLYSFTSSLGQIFLFQFLEKYGPLTLSIITGVRKILSIALSIVFFGKVVSVLKIVSLILGTTVIAWEVSDKTSKSSHSHGGTPHHVDKGETKSK